MTFASKVTLREVIISDDNARRFRRYGAGNDTFGTGYVPRDYAKHPLGYHSPIASIERIPRSEWPRMIKQREERGMLLSKRHRDARLPILNQGRNGYCWAFGGIGAFMLQRELQGLKPIHFSASSIAAQIKGGRDQGGWFGEVVENWNKPYHLYEHADFPEQSRDLNRLPRTEEKKRAAASHGVAEWEELPSQDFDMVMTYLLLGIPVTLGLIWWGHLVYAVDPILLGNGSFGLRIANSWGNNWSDGGFGILTESKATPHEAWAIRSVQISNASTYDMGLST